MAIKSQAHVAAPKGGDINAAKQKALQAAKNLEEYFASTLHNATIMQGLVKTMTVANYFIDDIVHYHVYGDYRLLGVSQVLGPPVHPPSIQQSLTQMRLRSVLTI